MCIDLKTLWILKILNEKSIREHNVDTQKNDSLCEDLEAGKFNHCKKANKLIKNLIEWRVMQSMKKIVSKEKQSVIAINALIIPEPGKYKLTAITLKLHQSIQLT